ncbi:MAG: sugar ABC transporter substrate-binding protein [Clostridia bacterium]|nr:sugar ABC transporter substrate-binding protein [Clostridia bacterium]
MKKKLQRVAAGALIVSSIAALCGCGQKTSDKDEQGRTVISVGGWPLSEGKSLDAMNQRKETFEKENPDVFVKGDSWSFSIDTFYAKAAGGTLPTVYSTNFTELAQIISSGYSADLTDVLKKRGYDGKFNPAILDLASKDGKVYSFPTSAYILGLGYNTELFEQAGLMEADGTPKQPKDWDEVAEFAKIIKEKTGKAGIVFPTAGNQGGWMFTPLAYSYGVEFVKKGEDGKWTAAFNTPECVEALQWVKDLKWKHNVVPENVTIDADKYYELFSTGQAAMMIAPGNYSDYVIQYGMTPDQLGIMAYPAGPKRHVTLVGGELQSVTSKATDDQVDAAVRWIETKCNYQATDAFKQTTQNNIEKKLSDNVIVGIKGMSVWNRDTESVAYENDLIDQKCNINPNHVKLYNDFVQNPCELQAEVPVCAQELYKILDNCITSVFSDENADCAAIIEKACKDFQMDYLDNVDY